ncbi:hypothetical protein AB1Y20_017269 [Prymnesium parvum]|uniref:Alpha-1,4-N-acetylglucosaminyltransferase n=1 Tax=Prymnesium parvum TaxID=97485 RepID=A0AB34JL54_PRYPA
MAARFPTVVHQTWRTHEVPRGLKAHITSWQRLMPDWEYVLHTDSDNDALVAAEYPWLLSTYRGMSAIQRADLARYMYMHKYGGVYADLDVQLLQPLGSLLVRTNSSVLLGQEPLEHALLLERKPRQVCNAVLVSFPGHPFWLDVLHTGARGARFGDPVGSTGPRMLERVVARWERSQPRQIAVLPPAVFYPTFDTMQIGTLRQRCRDERVHIALLGTEAMRALARAVCTRLQAHHFAPWIPSDGSAFTEHTWSHTWINGASKVNVWDSVHINRRGRAKRRGLGIKGKPLS